ncbi:MAG: T9SS type A sorting domain-containing protein [Bacteroidota bacterium]
MKKIYLIILLAGIFKFNFAQSFEWAKDEGRYAYDYGYGITTDNNGNVYVTGKYEDNAIFSGVTLPCQGNHDIYLAQYSPSGTLNWIKTGGGFNGDYAHAIATNKTSNVYITGEVEDGNAIISFPGSTVTLNPAGDNDIFIAAYDLSGNLQWARTDGYYYNEKALGMALDNTGNIVICGYYYDTTRFAGIIIPSKGLQDMFVAKYTATGDLLWMKHAGGPGRDEGKSVECDASGNIYVCGMYSDGAIFGSTTYTTANTPFGKFYDGYVAKYDPNGTLLWVKSIVGDYDDVAWSITKDNNNKIYVSGEFSGAKFDGSTDVWPNGYADAFVVSYDQNGNYQWVSHGGGPVADRARGIGSDGTTIFMTGQFGLNSNFGTASVTAADSSDIFISALDNMGNFLWTKTVGGIADTFEVNGYESGIAICAQTGFVYTTGAILDGGSFDGNNLLSYKRTDAFIAKLSVTVSLDELLSDHKFTVFPNPNTGMFSIKSNEYEDTQISVSNSLGETCYCGILSGKETIIDLTQFKSGIYFLKITTQMRSSCQKIIIN